MTNTRKIQENKDTGENMISDERLEEIKIEHYNRKMLGATQDSNGANEKQL